MFCISCRRRVRLCYFKAGWLPVCSAGGCWNIIVKSDCNTLPLLMAENWEGPKQLVFPGSTPPNNPGSGLNELLLFSLPCVIPLGERVSVRECRVTAKKCLCSFWLFLPLTRKPEESWKYPTQFSYPDTQSKLRHQYNGLCTSGLSVLLDIAVLCGRGSLGE